MKNILSRIFTVLAASAMLLTVSCAKMGPANEPEVLLDVNSSNVHGNWQLVKVNGANLPEGSSFYINFDRSGDKFRIWDSMNSIPSSYDYSEGTFKFYTEPEIGTYIRGIDSTKEEWGDLYVVKKLSRHQMVWVGVNDPTFVQVFNKVTSIPFAD